MRATYNQRTDTLTFQLTAGPVAESDEEKPGVILDYDEGGNLVGIEIPDASTRISNVTSLEFRVQVEHPTAT